MKMKVIFYYQDTPDPVKNGVTPIGEDVTDEQKDAHKYLRKKDYKYIFIIHQCVDPDNFEKVCDVDLSEGNMGYPREIVWRWRESKRGEVTNSHMNL